MSALAQTETLPLTGKTVVLTGVFHSRADIERKIVELGGTVSDRVDSDIGLMLAGDFPGSRLNRARQLGVKVVSEAEFLSGQF